MATLATSATNGNVVALRPFYFNSSAHLLRVGREEANTLGEFLDAVRTCPEDSIFQHTFRTLQEHHFIREGFSNDFAEWALTACNEVELAERLATIDVREFTSLQSLRNHIARVVEEYLLANPRAASRQANKKFYFCATDIVILPTPFVAHDRNEFLDSISRISVHSIHHHFIEARLRLKLRSNDFSLWLEEDLKLAQAARRLERIDIYTGTLEDVRRQMIRIVSSASA
jgi:hypothetical protein